MLRCCFAKNLFIVFLPLLCSTATQQGHKTGWVQLEKCGIVGKWREDSEYLDYLWNWRPQCSHSWVKQDQDIQFLNSYINLIICTFIVWYGASGIEMELISDYIPRVGSWERGSSVERVEVLSLIGLRWLVVLEKVTSEANPKVRNHGEGPY